MVLPAARDHPRSRGEYRTPWIGILPEFGSSPLSRGIRSVPLPVGRIYRIIPALAGNTWCLAGMIGRCWDHPRSRGEYPKLNWMEMLVMGSSPLSRGILSPQSLPQNISRIIPALAGNTLVVWVDRLGCGDHPRSRGEYFLCAPRRGPNRGSSPLSRGIPIQLGPRGRPVRIIPALAGNTELVRLRRQLGQDHPRSRGEYVAPRRRTHSCSDHPRSRGEYTG